MIRAKAWDGDDLKGDWLFTYKIDGVRAKWDGEQWLSRKGKPLYNIPHPKEGVTDVEVYLGSFKKSIQATRTKNVSVEINYSDVYSLDPIDLSLKIEVVNNPTKEFIISAMNSAIDKGYEGLVLRQNDKWIKVKPEETHDVVITGLIPGKGKHEGKLGAFTTVMGNVGTGFTDQERIEYNTSDLIGETMEVSCMHLTEDGLFRHPRFKRIRYDK